MNTKYLKQLIQIVAASAAMIAAPALAGPIAGTAVDGIGGATIDAGPEIEFFIPISEEQWDLTQDTNDQCDASGAGVGNCGSGATGFLSMYLAFDIDWTGMTEATINFDDFDAVGFGDNDYFIEFMSLKVLDGGGAEILVMDAAAVLGGLEGNSSTQSLDLTFNTPGDFYIHLIFGTEFVVGETPDSRFGNTPESLNALAASVPEPGTLALLGVGLMALAFARRRKIALATTS